MRAQFISHAGGVLMDASRFDLLTQALSTASSRRRLLAALLAGLLTSRRPAATVVADHLHRKQQGQGKSRGAGQGKGKSQAHRRHKARAQATPPASCFGSGSCLPGPAANLAKCDFTDSTVLENVNCTGATSQTPVCCGLMPAAPTSPRPT